MLFNLNVIFDEVLGMSERSRQGGCPVDIQVSEPLVTAGAAVAVATARLENEKIRGKRLKLLTISNAIVYK